MSNIVIVFLAGLVAGFFSAAILFCLVNRACRSSSSSSSSKFRHARRLGSPEDSIHVGGRISPPTQQQASKHDQLVVPPALKLDRDGFDAQLTIFSEVLFFPDEKLPCTVYYKVLLGTHRTCNCFQRKRDKKMKFLHVGERTKSSLLGILKCLAGAKKSIDLCVMAFSLRDTAHLLIELSKKRSIKVRVITDAGRGERDADQIPTLQAGGIEVRENPSKSYSSKYRPLMHHKYAIIDDELCFHGSLNWTYHGVFHNQESVIKTSDPRIVKPLVANFYRNWHSLPKATRPTNNNADAEMALAPI